MRQPSGPVSKAIVDAFVWREICHGWTLLDRPNLHVVQERMPPQTFELRHVHTETHQFYFVLEGRATIERGNDEFHVERAQAIEIPPGCVHKMRNDSQSDLEFLVISSHRPRDDRQDLE